MKSWKLLPMAMLLAIAWPGAALADADAEQVSDETVSFQDPDTVVVQADSVVDEVSSNAGTEGTSAESVAADTTIDAPAKPQVPAVPAPLDPARPLPQSDAPGSFAFGPIGVDAEGRTGRIHLVARGDTLWDISEAYLGTPWVWPSVWNENSEIENPHLIVPGDRIWISSTEMRRVTESEAEELVAAAQTETPEPEEVVEEVVEEVAEVAPAAMDETPASEPMVVAGPAPEKKMVTVSWKEAMGFITKQQLDAATSIVGSSSDRNWLAQGDTVYVGLGKGAIQPGDQFMIFEEIEAVRSLNTGRLLGYHVKNLGWLEIESVNAESAIAKIEESWFEMERGARLIKRGDPTATFAVEPASSDIAGRIVYLPSSRTVMGTIDHVYLDLGASDGLEVGSELSIITPEHKTRDEVRRTSVVIPDQSFGSLVIVSTQPHSSVALVTHTRAELQVGQWVRGSAGMPASN